MFVTSLTRAVGYVHICHFDEEIRKKDIGLPQAIPRISVYSIEFTESSAVVSVKVYIYSNSLDQPQI